MEKGGGGLLAGDGEQGKHTAGSGDGTIVDSAFLSGATSGRWVSCATQWEPRGVGGGGAR